MRVEVIGDATLYCGDALEVLASLPSGCAHGIVADSPYSSGGFTRGDRTADTGSKYQSSGLERLFANFAGDNRDQRAYEYWTALWLGQALRITVEGSMLCTFTDWRQLPTTTDAVQAGGWVWRGIAVWDKVNARPMPNRFRQSAEFIVWATNGAKDFDTEGAEYHDGVFTIPAPPTSDREHATQKPVILLDKLVQVVRPGQVIVDTFMGSGTTGVSCMNTGRKFIGAEQTEHFFDVSCKRIEEAYRARPRLFEPEIEHPRLDL